MDRSGIEWKLIDERAVSEGSAEVVTGAETAMDTSNEATTMTEGEWEDPPETVLAARIPLSYPLVCINVRDKERETKY